MSAITPIASLADRAFLIWPMKGMAMSLGGALSFLAPSCPELPELGGGGGGDAEKGTARPTSERRTTRHNKRKVMFATPIN